MYTYVCIHTCVCADIHADIYDITYTCIKYTHTQTHAHAHADTDTGTDTDTPAPSCIGRGRSTVACQGCRRRTCPPNR